MLDHLIRFVFLTWLKVKHSDSSVSGQSFDLTVPMSSFRFEMTCAGCHAFENLIIMEKKQFTGDLLLSCCLNQRFSVQ